MSIQKGTFVIIAAAGGGKRMGARENKIFIPIKGVSVIERTVRTFLSHPLVEGVVVVGSKNELVKINTYLDPIKKSDKVLVCIAGGAERQHSVRLGLEWLEKENPKKILVHDGARPLVSPKLISAIIDGLEKENAVVPGVPIHDTVRRWDKNKSNVVSREGLFRTQTPQGFDYKLLLQAHQKAYKEGSQGTDDAQLVEMLGESVLLVMGEETNLKLTTKADLRIMESLILDE